MKNDRTATRTFSILIVAGIAAVVLYTGWRGYKAPKPNDSPNLTDIDTDSRLATAAKRRADARGDSVTEDASSNDALDGIDDLVGTAVAESGKTGTEFEKWDTASYEPFLTADGVPDPDQLERIVDRIPVTLLAEVDEPQYEELLLRIRSLVDLYATNDADSYTAFFTKGGGVPQKARVEKYAEELKDSLPDIDTGNVDDEIAVYREKFVDRNLAKHYFRWNGIASELSEIKIESGGAHRTLSDEINLLPKKTSVISTHLKWDYPNTREDLADEYRTITYATVRVQLDHEGSEIKFPRTFLFY